ncbi:ATP-binding cassette domain-containing protein [Sulfidibacter corallicola]|uniref:ATP-binding cassette domain-containing protein n=1 Tax=Sulfidibacter corallicola TaxID=2818388 RepID=A0A8A4TNN3_SULCO|nr:ABC transporter transmembrane domain-containing protein [Sulfidibacter corallicola]QTD50814.1 ATP-binding cassette domain-containing protein [Sulfidibacter corallicola]
MSQEPQGETTTRLTLREAYQRMFALARPEWRILVSATLFLIVGSGMGLLYPQVIRGMVDDALASGLTAVNRAVLILAVIFMVQAIAVGLRHYLFTIAGYRIVTKLQSDTYRRIVSQEVGFFDKRRTGELMSRLASDTTVLQNTVSVNISMALRGLASAIGGIALLAWTSPRLTLIMLLAVPPVSIGGVWIGRKIRFLSKAVQDALAKAGEVAEETLSGIRTVRAFGREATEAERYEQGVHRAYVAMRRRTGSMALFHGVLSFAAYGITALMLWYGARMVDAGDITVGELTSFLLYTLIVAVSLASLASLWADFMRATGSADRIFEILDREPEIPLTDGTTLERVDGHIRLEQVTFRYPTRPDVSALRQITLEIRPGEIVALVGPSGSGKSTLAALLPRFYDAQEGRIYLDGHNLTTLSPTWLRGRIGSVPQEPILFSRSIAENIAYGSETDDPAAIEAAARVANAHDFILHFPEGYQTEVGERGVRLSGGQKQRIAIARAVLKDPEILILDEATSALDAESEFLVKQALERLMKGRTTLIIAHRLSTVRDADRVVVLDGGRLAEMGSHEALMMRPNGVYRKLVERQFLAS